MKWGAHTVGTSSPYIFTFRIPVFLDFYDKKFQTPARLSILLIHGALPEHVK
jgi:hypothetical protein